MKLLIYRKTLIFRLQKKHILCTENWYILFIQKYCEICKKEQTWLFNAVNYWSTVIVEIFFSLFSWLIFCFFWAIFYLISVGKINVHWLKLFLVNPPCMKISATQNIMLQKNVFSFVAENSVFLCWGPGIVRLGEVLYHNNNMQSLAADLFCESTCRQFLPGPPLIWLSSPVLTHADRGDSTGILYYCNQ